MLVYSLGFSEDIKKRLLIKSFVILYVSFSISKYCTIILVTITCLTLFPTENGKRELQKKKKNQESNPYSNLI